jgi:hypothetical protein
MAYLILKGDKMDASKITEKDWEKANRMSNACSTYRDILPSMAIIAIMIILGGLVIISVVLSNAIQANAQPVTNYTFYQILNQSPTLAKFIRNTSLTSNFPTYSPLSNAQIINITNDSKVLPVFTLFTYVRIASIINDLELLNITMAVILVMIYIKLINSPDTKSFPSSYKALRQRVRTQERRKARLLAANYTEADIKWFEEFITAIKEV